MKDSIGQEIVPGARVLWMGGTGQYAGSGVYRVQKLTAKQVSVEFPHTHSSHIDIKSLHPSTLVVVDMNLEALGK